MVSLTPPVSKRLRRLRAMGASAWTETPSSGGGARYFARVTASPTRRLPTWLGILILAPLVEIVAVLVVLAAALTVYLVAFTGFVILAIVAGPIHELLRGLSGR